jgi:predicted metal-binding protein
MLQRKPRYDDLEFRKFLRKYQWACLLKGKRKATQELDQTQETVFKTRHP